MEKTRHQILRFLEKVAEKFPETEDPVLLTDIHVQVSQDTGDIMAFDDNDKEITRCVIEPWINNHDNTESFYRMAEEQIRDIIAEKKFSLGIMKPYNYVLENENGEHIAEIFVVDDSETIILGSPFMENLDKELDDFINNLLRE